MLPAWAICIPVQTVIDGETAYGMSPQVLAAVVRLATHARIFVRPSRLVDAIAFTSLLLEQPHCQLIQPGDRHWKIFSDLCRTANATGNLTQDAWYAALAIEAGCEWVTTDGDFARFKGLVWRAPF